MDAGGGGTVPVLENGEGVGRGTCCCARAMPAKAVSPETKTAAMKAWLVPAMSLPRLTLRLAQPTADSRPRWRFRGPFARRCRAYIPISMTATSRQMAIASKLVLFLAFDQDFALAGMVRLPDHALLFHALH